MRTHSIPTALFVIVLAVLSAAQAAEAPSNADIHGKRVEPAQPPIEVVPVVIHAAASPRPALKYHLLPTFLESTPGDAMPLYAKALVRHVEIWKNMQNETLEKRNKSPSGFTHLEKWLGTPLDKLPRDQVRKLVDAFGGVVRSQLELAVRREHCNWDAPLRQGRVFEILLPEVQEFRNMARIVALRARLQIAEGQYAEAIASLQTGYGMARQVAEQPFLVCGLVGAAIANMMNEQLLTLCQQPNAPNLYWSIVQLPAPFIDRQKSIAAEYDGLYLQWPELAAARREEYVPEQWNLVLRRIVGEMVRYEGEINRNHKSDKQRAVEVEKTITHALQEISRAKANLVAAGHARQDVAAMSPAQIVVLNYLDTYQGIRDEVFKSWPLPYWQALAELDVAESKVASVMKDELLPAASLPLPSVLSALLAFARTDRQLATIRCIEALRLYVADHDGELPPTLDEIKEVPIPLNPMTGKPFPYHLEGKTAVLDADGGLTNVPRPQYRVVVAK